MGPVKETAPHQSEEPSAEEQAVTPEEAKPEDPAELACRLAQQEYEAAQAKLKHAAEILLTMRSKIAELKTYKVEPKHVEVLQAVFVLLGDKKKDVQDWQDIRKKLMTDFFETITAFDSGHANKKMLKRAVQSRKLIEGKTEEEVHAGSDAMAGIFAWVSSAIESLEASAAMALAQQAGDSTGEPPALADGAEAG